MEIQIAPSILSANFAFLAAAARSVEGAADLLHIDVMDNVFVPNLSIGLQGMRDLRAATDLPFNCHLMVVDGDRWGPTFADEGVHSVVIHVEATRFPVRALRSIRQRGVLAGLALNPATPIEPYLPLLTELDIVQLLTTEPGFGGQPLLEFVLSKVELARQRVEADALPVQIAVDGGVTETTVEACARAGAQIFVSGAVYGDTDSAQATRTLRHLATQASRPRPV